MRTELSISIEEQEQLRQEAKAQEPLFGAKYADRQQITDKHCLLVHGWNSDSAAMGKIYQELKKAPESLNFTFWRVDYDSQSHFSKGAEQVRGAIQELKLPLERTIIFCYSMGGVIMREVLSASLPFHALISVCSPHQGMLVHIDEGSASLNFNSPGLQALNRHPVDRANRKRFNFYGISHSNPLGYHASDSVVNLNSSMGIDLGPAVSAELHVRYQGPHNPFEPHSLGTEPRFIGPALQRCRHLMQGLK